MLASLYHTCSINASVDVISLKAFWRRNLFLVFSFEMLLMVSV